MVKTYKNIKDINANFNASTVEAAVKLVVEKNRSIREAAAHHKAIMSEDTGPKKTHAILKEDKEIR